MAAGGAAADELRRAYRENVAAVYGFFAWSVAPAVAEDLTSGTFERVVRSWRSYDPRVAPVRTWILAIARNLLTDHFRRGVHRQAHSLDADPLLSETLSGADAGLDAVLSDDALARLLAPLPLRDRQVLALRYAADLPATDVAEVLGISAANVHQIASRALRRLRAELGPEELSDSA